MKKNELRIWQLITDLDRKKKQAAVAAILSLMSKAKESGLNCKVEDLNLVDEMD